MFSAKLTADHFARAAERTRAEADTLMTTVAAGALTRAECGMLGLPLPAGTESRAETKESKRARRTARVLAAIADDLRALEPAGSTTATSAER